MFQKKTFKEQDMQLYPAIDLRGGRAVRLFQGDYNNMTVYSDSPVNVAQDFEKAGATFLHIVDLDGAKDGNNPNFELISEIVRATNMRVQVGGGIRSIETVQRYINSGVSRVVIGTAAVTDPVFLEEAIAAFGEKIAVGVDIKGEKVAIHGWTRSSEKNCFDFCAELEQMGVKTLICTDISKDGAMQGPCVELYRRLVETCNMDIIASGGVSVFGDLVALAETKVEGAILGKSLYTGSISLAEALCRMGELYA